jgi:hypothetical protein
MTSGCFLRKLNKPQSECLMAKITSPGGLDLSRSCLDRDSRSQHWQRAGLNSRENLDTFKILVSTIKKSWLRSRFLNLVSMANLDQEITWFFTYLDWDIYLNCRNLWKVVGEAQGKHRKVKVKPSPTTFHRCLKSKISRLMSRNLDNSQLVLTISISLDSLD